MALENSGSHGMRLDLVLPNEGPSALDLVRDAGRFEEMGYSGLWVTDHVVGYQNYPAIYGDYWLECLSTLSYIAGITSKIRLGLGILVVPYRDAVLTAKMLASIDRLSGGRIDLGIGTGWSADEFAGLGREHIYERRGAYTSEALEVFQYCWREQGDLSFKGEFINFSGMRFEPKPVQTPRIPFWIGSGIGVDAKSPAARRVARYADVWHPTTTSGRVPSIEEIRTGKAAVEEIAGRPVPISIRLHSVGHLPVDDIVALLAMYRDAGCVQVAVELGHLETAMFCTKAECLLSAARKAGILDARAIG